MIVAGSFKILLHSGSHFTNMPAITVIICCQKMFPFMDTNIIIPNIIDHTCDSVIFKKLKIIDDPKHDFIRFIYIMLNDIAVIFDCLCNDELNTIIKFFASS